MQKIFGKTIVVNKNPDISLITLFFCILILGTIVFGQFPNNVLSWDVFGYYLYLPLSIIYNDLGLNDYTIIDGIIHQYENTSTFYQAIRQPEGQWVMKYPMGMAILYLPWFLIGHFFAFAGGFEPDGFSYPYQASLLYGSLVYTVIGLIYFRKSMLFFFKPITTAILLLIIVFGTNYLAHTAFHGQGLMSHNYLFSIFALILWFTIKWHEKPKIKYAVYLGLLVGIATLGRLTEIMVAFIPVLWGTANSKGLIDKAQLFHKRFADVLVFAGLVALFISFQAVYYKIITGSFIYYSYANNPGEGLDFFSPYVSQVLFSFRKGWLVYTPVMAFAMFGFVPLFQNRRGVFYAILVYFSVTFYITASWSCWWYADCFSQRALIPAYVFLAIPMGQLIENGLKAVKWKKFALLISIILIVALNLFQSWQIINGIIHTSRMTRDYYKAVFLKTFIPDNATDLLLVDRSKDPYDLLKSGKKYDQKVLFDQLFGIDSTYHSISANKNFPGIEINQEKPFSPSFSISYDDIAIKEYGIIEVRVSVYSAIDPALNPFSLVATFTHKENAYAYKALDAELLDIATNEWSNLSLYYLTPEVRSKHDVFKTYVWLRGNQPMFIKQLSVILHRPV